MGLIQVRPKSAPIARTLPSLSHLREPSGQMITETGLGRLSIVAVFKHGDQC